jgi:hypothetical protein
MTEAETGSAAAETATASATATPPAVNVTPPTGTVVPGTVMQTIVLDATDQTESLPAAAAETLIKANQAHLPEAATAFVVLVQAQGAHPAGAVLCVPPTLSASLIAAKAARAATASDQELAWPRITTVTSL